MHYIYRNWNFILWVPAIVALSGVGPAQAQNPVAGWPDKDFTVARPEVVQFPNRGQVLRAGTFANQQDEDKFTDYYTKSLFPNVTNPANRLSSREDVVAKLRTDLKVCEKAPEQQVFNKLADLILEYMSKIAKDGQCHPVARVNAMLAIGEVNSPKAVNAVLATLSDPKQIDAVRVAAMTDLVHLAGQSSLSDPDVAQPVIVRMARIVRAPIPKSDSPQSARADGIRWMRGQAADVLAELGSIGPQGEVPPALLTMLNDKDLPIPIRSKAARALGKLKYNANPPAAGPYLTALVEFACDALSSDQPASRARVRAVSHDIEDGLKKFDKSTVSSDLPLIDGLQKALQTLNRETADRMTEEDLKTAIAKAKTALDGLSKNKR